MTSEAQESIRTEIFDILIGVKYNKENAGKALEQILPFIESAYKEGAEWAFDNFTTEVKFSNWTDTNKEYERGRNDALKDLLIYLKASKNG